MADKRFSELTSATTVADADILAISQNGLSKQLAASILKSYAQTGVVLKTSATGAAFLPTGTTGERPGSPSAGSIRYNSTTGKFEGYGSAWGNIGGGAVISNDTSTASTLYPVFASATSGIAETLSTSDANLLYRPSTGELTAQTHVSANGLTVNSATVSVTYSIPSGSNAISAGPVSVNSGVTVTVPSGSVWYIS